MNNKYFGNSLDLLKYDILTYLTQIESSELFYIPMLTEPEPKMLDPKYKLHEVGSQNKVLLELMLKAHDSKNNLDMSYIRNYFNDIKLNYKIILNKQDNDKNTFTINNIQYFSNENRNEYFTKSIELYEQQTQKTLLFIDPCVGIDLAVKRRVRSNKSLYLKVEELKTIISKTKHCDTVCYFQHLGNPTYKLNDRIFDLKKEFGEHLLVVGYERILCSMVFLFKTETEYLDKKRKLELYIKKYDKIKNYNKIILQ